MSQRNLEIRELAGWGFSTQMDRGSLSQESLENAARRARVRLAERTPYQSESPVCIEQTSHLSKELTGRREAVAVSGEFDGLKWQLAVVDIRKLIAFQRQIRFASNERLPMETATNWSSLLDLALPLKQSLPQYAVCTASDGKSLTVRSASPNLTVRFAHSAEVGLGSVQLVPYAGSPYFEVASYRDRWFLRDGYHRSFLLLKQGIYHLPAVVVHANSLAELGALGYRFFSEETLFSERPPMMSDFLDAELVACFTGPQQEKSVQISIQELWQPIQAKCLKGEQS